MKKKNLKYIILIVVISFALSFLMELFFNRNVLFLNNTKEAKVLEVHGLEKKGKWYQATKKDSYLIMKFSTDYMNKLRFDYQSKKDFLWDIELQDEKISNSSSELIDQAIRKFGKNIPNKPIRINFHEKNIKVSNFYIDNKIDINFIRLLVMISSCFGVGILILYRKTFLKHLEKAFLFIAILSGGIMILTVPKNVFVSWDDQIHIKHAYEFMNSEFSDFSPALRLITTHYKIDGDTFQTQEEKILVYQELNKLHLKKSQDKIQVNNYSAKYNRVVYLPFFIGFQIAKGLNLNYITTFILAKLFNFLCYVLLMYCAIKVSTYAKKIIFLISLFVSNIFLSTQFSYDPTIIASITLSIALFLRMLEEQKLSKKYWLGFIFCNIWASLPKAIYCPLLLLVLFIPNQKFDSKKQAHLLKGVIIALTLLLMSTFVLPMLSGSVSGDPRGGATNASLQLKFIFSNPFRYIKILMKFFILNGATLTFGEGAFISLSYINDCIEPIIPFIYITNFILLLYVVFTDKFDKKLISNKMKIVFGTCFIGISVLICTALYISFTPVASTTIAGVQTRYFIPLFILLLLILKPTSNHKQDLKIQKQNIFLLLIPFLSLMITNFLLVYMKIGI
ncbi:MAG: DUF2142 domain-containing protein [Bacilli bacterium]|nr:DUF2142 domain-containing protein [Bacilli bacterium]